MAGDTIMVCPGLYAEQVKINKTLTLLGAGVAGFLIWLGSRIAGDSPSGGEFWAFAGLAAA